MPGALLRSDAHSADAPQAHDAHISADVSTPLAPDIAPCGMYAVIVLACVTLILFVVLCQVARALNQFAPATIDNAVTRFAALIVLVIFVAQSLLVDALRRDICCDHRHL